MIPRRVLHVDDESDIREVVQFSLELDPSLMTRGCASGKEALVVAAEWLPEIILLDVMMPEMDGPSTLSALRENPVTAPIPVAFMTARAQSRELDLFRSLGAVGVISKPFDPMTLAASLNELIDPLETRLAKMRQDFRQRAGRDMFILSRACAALSRATENGARLLEIRHIAHGLAGGGGVFGLAAISEAAADLETAVIREREGRCTGTFDEIESAVVRLAACVSDDPGHMEKR